MLFLSTVSTNVTINDLKSYTFNHPTISFPLYDVFTKEDIEESTDLQTAIDTNLVIIQDSFGNVLNDVNQTTPLTKNTYDNNDDGKIDASASQVESVNGQTGIVVINEPNFTGTSNIAGANDGVVTDDGVDATNERILFDDGTWKYARDLYDENNVKRVEAVDGGEVNLSLYNNSKDDGKSIYNRNAYFDASGNIQVGESRSSFIKSSGRFHCFTNNRWVTESDDLFGSNNQNFNENSGNNATVPTLEWEHLGLLLPANVFIKNLHFMCRSNNNEVTDFTFYIVERRPTNIAAYQSGYDGDNEMTNTLIYNETWRNSVGSFTGNMNDMHYANIPINHTTTEIVQISIYVKPIGSISSTRYIYSNWTWEII